MNNVCLRFKRKRRKDGKKDINDSKQVGQEKIEINKKGSHLRRVLPKEKEKHLAECED